MKSVTSSKAASTTKKSSKSATAGTNGHSSGDEETYNLRLYVAGQTFSNLKKLCEEYLPGRYRIEVIDLVENPQLAAGDQILALPTLVRKLPEPLKRIIGNLSDKEKFLVGMDLKPQS